MGSKHLYPPNAMPETEVQIARDEGFQDIVDRDSVAAVIQRYVPAKALEPGKYYWRVRHVHIGQPPMPWTKPSSFQVFLPKRTFHIPLGSSQREIQKILMQANQASPSRVLFEKGKWEDYLTEAFINLEGCKGLLIDGNGSSFGLKGFGSFAEFKDCSEIHIKGFSVEFLELGHTAGKVIAKDKGKSTVDIKLLPGYPSLEEVPLLADFPEGLITGSGQTAIKDKTIWHARTKLGFKNLGKRVYRFEVEKMDFPVFEIGDTYFKGPKWDPGIHLHTCNDITLSDFQLFLCQGTTVKTVRSNRVRILGLDIKPKEGREWSTTNRAQQHLNARIGHWVENCIVQGTVRDVCLVGSRAFPVRKVLTPIQIQLGAFPFFNPGESVQFFDREKGKIISTCKVTEIRMVEQGDEGSLIVTLDQPAGNVRVGEGWPSKTDATLAFNMNRQGNQFVWRNNQCMDIQMKGLICTGTGGLVENNIFKGLGHGAVELRNTRDAGISANGYVIRNNRFEKCGAAKRWYPNAAIQTMNFNGTSPLHKDILISDNVFSGYLDRAVLVSNAENVVIRGNRIANTHFKMFTKEPGVIEISHASNVSIEDNTIEESRPLPKGAVLGLPLP